MNTMLTNNDDELSTRARRLFTLTAMGLLALAAVYYTLIAPAVESFNAAAQAFGH